jgi:CheY-like chemotaxis protein
LVLEAANGREALARLANVAPDVILLDLIMPEMDGFELIEELRHDEVWRRLPVVVVTAAELSDRDHERLNGSVLKVLHKTGTSREALLAELLELLAPVRLQARGLSEVDGQAPLSRGRQCESALTGVRRFRPATAAPRGSRRTGDL